MNNKTTIIFSFLLLNIICFSAIGQTNLDDTKNKLFGTTVLWGSENILEAENAGLFLTNFSSSNCDMKNFDKSKTDSISSIEIKAKTLEIEIQITGNCCYSFLGEINYKNDTLNLIYQGYGTEICFCTCCFGLTYSIETMELETIKYVMLNGNKSTLIKLE